MNKAEIKIVEEQINNCWQVASEIIEEFDMYGGGPEEEENRACEELEKMQELLEIIICHGSLRSEFLGKLCRL